MSGKRDYVAKLASARNETVTWNCAGAFRQARGDADAFSEGSTNGS
jgi:hypothetical protein